MSPRKKKNNIKSDSKKDENTIIIETEHSVLPDVIRSEVNFLVYPIFKIDKKKDEDGTIEFKATIKRGEQKIEIFWGVYPHQKYGIPGAFDKKVFDAIQEIIEELPKPIPNIIPIGSLYSLCKRIGVHPGSGKNLDMVRDALIRLTVTPIRSIWTFYDKGRKRWIDDIFHIYERIIWIGDELPDGTIADTNYIYLGSKYVENVNNGYVKPIDYKFYKALNSNISRRLYEILGVKFYPIFQKQLEFDFIRYQYDTLCELIPLRKQKHLSLIKQQFEAAIRELQEGKFLEKVEIKEESGKFYLHFYPGPRARDEFIRFRPELTEYQDPQASDNDTQTTLGIDKETRPEKFIEYFYKKNSGINIDYFKPKEIEQADRLLIKYGEDLAYFIIDYAIESAKKTNFEMKTFSAVLQYEREAVERYEMIKKIKKNEEERKKRQEEEERLEKEERERLEQMAEEIDRILSSLSDEDYEEIRKEAELLANERGSIFVKEGKPIPNIIIDLCMREIIRKKFLK